MVINLTTAKVLGIAMTAITKLAIAMGPGDRLHASSLPNYQPPNSTLNSAARMLGLAVPQTLLVAAPKRRSAAAR